MDDNFTESRRSALILQWVARFLSTAVLDTVKAERTRGKLRNVVAVHNRVSAPFIYNRRGVDLSCPACAPGHRIRRNITVINQRQTGAKVMTVWQFSPAVLSPLCARTSPENSTCSSRKKADSLTEGKEREREKKIHHDKGEAIALGKRENRARDIARQTKRERRRWNCTPDARERLVSPSSGEKRDLQIVALFLQWFCLISPRHRAESRYLIPRSRLLWFSEDTTK